MHERNSRWSISQAAGPKYTRHYNFRLRKYLYSYARVVYTITYLRGGMVYAIDKMQTDHYKMESEEREQLAVQEQKICFPP